MIVVSNNCELSVLCKNSKADNVFFVNVNGVGDLPKLRNPAIKDYGARYSSQKRTHNQPRKRARQDDRSEKKFCFLVS